jgi:hypothetical protein
MKQLKVTFVDYVLSAFTLVFCGGIVLLNIFL